MTTAIPHEHTSGNMTLSRFSSLIGTLKLLAFMLRRDRIRLPLWVFGLSLMMLYFANALGTVLTDEALKSMAALASSPMFALIGGPGYGFDSITVGKIIVGVYSVYIMIGAALMSILTISRHTRVEEQSGRAELIRANIIGRHAPLAAALILVALMNLLLVGLLAVIFQFSAIEVDSFQSSLLLASSIGSAGLFFAGVTAVTAQISAYSRTASGIAGVVLAVSFVVRGLGDMSFVQGGNLGWMSWLSPLGWAQQTAPLTLDRWWPLIISLLVTTFLIALSFVLQTRRDLDAGLLPDRLGEATAPTWLRNSLTFAFLLQRSTLLWWSFALLLGGLIFGAFVQPMAENAEGMPPEIMIVFGGSDKMVEGYLGFMGLYFAIMSAIYAILAAQSLRTEEEMVRTETLLAAGISRKGWLESWALVTMLGSLILQTLAGFGVGIGASLTTGDWSLCRSALIGHIIQTPAVWLLFGIAITFYGIAPRFIGVTWAVFAWGAARSLFGDILQFKDAVLATSVFRTIGQYPNETISWGVIGLLLALSIALLTIGVQGFRRRDLVAT